MSAVAGRVLSGQTLSVQLKRDLQASVNQVKKKGGPALEQPS
jgi:hypothetical protein